MKFILPFLLVLGMVCTLQVYANSQKIPPDLLEIAKSWIAKNHFNRAIKIMHRTGEALWQQPEATYFRMELYLQANRYEEAYGDAQALLYLDSTQANYHRGMAQACLGLQNWEQAEAHYARCAQLSQDPLDQERHQFLLRSGAKLQKPPAYRVKTLPFNTSGKEFSLLSNGTNFVYTTNQPFQTMGIPFRQRKMDKSARFTYAIRRRDSLKWGPPMRLNHALSPLKGQDRPLLVYRDSLLIVQQPRKSDTSILAIKLQGRFWQGDSCDLFPFPTQVHSACLAPDEQTLVFSAPAGPGRTDLDLFISRRLASGQWPPPHPLPPSINTPKDELTPFLHADGRLFFSSNGHPGFGGFDLFTSRPQGKTWEIPQHLNHPISTPSDELYYWSTPDDSTAYLISNRSDNPQDFDIYELSHLFPPCDTVELPAPCITFSAEGYPVDTQAIDIHFDLGDGHILKASEGSHCYENFGDYYLQLYFVDRFSGEQVFLSKDTLLQIQAPSNSGPCPWRILPPLLPVAPSKKILLGWTFQPRPVLPSFFNGLLGVEQWPYQDRYLYFWQPDPARAQAEELVQNLREAGFPQARWVAFYQGQAQPNPLLPEEQLPWPETLAAEFQNREGFAFDLQSLEYAPTSSQLPDDLESNIEQVLSFLYAHSDWQLEVIFYPEPGLPYQTGQNMGQRRMRNLERTAAKFAYPQDRIHFTYWDPSQIHVIPFVWPNWEDRQLDFRWHFRAGTQQFTQLK